MSKIDSILSLISLLNSREYVSLQSIMKTLGISRRSVYRYLNTISEANFPVYYDEDVEGYRVVRQTKSFVPPLDLTDSILVLSSLIAMRGRLNGEYSAMISRIESRLLANLSTPLEEIIPAYRQELETADDQERVRMLINSLLVEVAMSNGRGVKMLRKTAPETASEVFVKSPSLWFKGQWKVVDRESVDYDNTLLSTIERVRIQ